MRLSTKLAPEPSRTSARDALAMAIERLASLRVERAKIEDAINKARAARFSATQRLESISVKTRVADPAVAYLTVLEGGAESCDIVQLFGAKDEEKARLQQEIAAWDQTVDGTKRLAAQLADDIKIAEMTVESRASAVIATEGDKIVRDAVERAEKLSAKLLKERVILRFFDWNGLFADEALRKHARSLLTFDLPTIRELEFVSFDSHPTHAELAAVREALKTDPDAPVAVV